MRAWAAILQTLHVLADPRLEGLEAREVGFDLCIGEELAGGGIHRDHLAGAKLTLPHDAGLVNRHRADLGAGDDEAIIGNDKAGGTQTVAVEGGTNNAPIGEREGGGAIPRLNETSVVLVKSAQGRTQIGNLLPRLGDKHRHGVADIAPGHHQQLKGVVQHRRVGAAFVKHGEEGGGAINHIAEEIRRQIEHTVAGTHPIGVALHRINLAIMRKQAERLGALPRRESIG